ncbi:MAG: PadR family transcriptional regulator [Aphanocapsa lilacina HA4352-LM1]|nr:PadR family transcriptional regulator [Aphanocapsa lilacina HA4352-LM1]
MAPTPEPQRFLPLTAPMFHILLVLSAGERHGYAIMRTVEERTAGQIRLGSGTLYPAIKRMLADGWIEEAGTRLDPALGEEQRRYYRLTDLGRQVAGAEAQRLYALVEAARAYHLLPEAGQHPAGWEGV